jgi:ubiquinone/menaquinone biosynthesis C-methylase UbiE
VDLWGRIFAATYDRAMAGSERAGLAAHRERLLAGAAGRVLEVGAGTGANLPYYGAGVSELVLVEPEEPMARRLERRLSGYRTPARVIHAPAEALPVEAEAFDVVVSTLVMCTVADPARSLAEMLRVLRPGGRLLFLEHVRAEDPAVARWQDRLRLPWSWVAHGCQCNRATVEAVGAAGFAIGELRRDRIPKAPAIVKPLVIGTATRVR